MFIKSNIWFDSCFNIVHYLLICHSEKEIFVYENGIK